MNKTKKSVIIILMIVITLIVVLFPQVMNYINRQDLKNKVMTTQLEQGQEYILTSKDILKIYKDINSNGSNYTVQNILPNNNTINSKDLLNKVFVNSQTMKSIINKINEQEIGYSKQRILYLLNDTPVIANFVNGSIKFNLTDSYEDYCIIDFSYEEKTGILLRFSIYLNTDLFDINKDVENIHKDVRNYYINNFKISQKDFYLAFIEQNSFEFGLDRQY